MVFARAGRRVGHGASPGTACRCRYQSILVLSLLAQGESSESIIKSRQIIGTFFEQLGLFLEPVFHRLKGRTVAQCVLRDVLIVDLNVAFDGIGEVLGGVEAGGG